MPSLVGPSTAAKVPECGILPSTVVNLVSPSWVQPVKSPVSKPGLATRQALGVGVGVGVGGTVAVGVGVGGGVPVAVGVGVGVEVGPDCAQYLPPVFRTKPMADPPQMIISLPVHTPVRTARAEGALTVVVGTQLSALGLYLPPVLKTPLVSPPPQTIISLPVHTPV